MDHLWSYLLSANSSDNGQIITRANSGAARFQVRFPTGRGICCFTLASNDDCHKDLYKIFLAPILRCCGLVDASKENEVHRLSRLPPPIYAEYRGFYITWYNNKINLGLQGQKRPFLVYEDDLIKTNNIGYIKFNMTAANFPVDWIFEAPPPSIQEITSPYFEDGKLKWMTMVDDHLPPDAMVGGFEDEPIYIARANHRRSMCPGKYVPSSRLAFIPWGHRAHSKDRFEILCGYNARWIKTKANAIPDNAFIGGYSEVHGEPLYIGRAMVGDNLICGKVHALYKKCYLPYDGNEVEVYSYEILVMPYVKSRGILPNANKC